MTTAGKIGKSHHQFLKVMAEKKVGNQNQAVTAEELAKHNTMESAWCSLNGTVYDVTVYINYHPGGKILLDGCGKECIDLFSTPSLIQTSTTPGSTPSTSSRSTASGSSPVEMIRPSTLYR